MELRFPMKLSSIVLSFSLAAATAAAGVSPALLNLVMPDATVVSGMNVAQSVTSPFGQYILAQMQISDAGFLKFMASTGFDPRKDLLEVLAATPATASSTTHSGLILGRGVFQPAMIIGTASEEGASVTNYHGFTLIGPPANQNGEQIALTFLDGSTVAIGDPAAVQAVIDRKVANATFTGSLASSAIAVSANNSAWFATNASLADFMGSKQAGNLGGVAQSGLMQSITQASGGVLFGSAGVTVSADAVTASAQNAQSLVDVLKFFVSMIAGNANTPSNVSSIASSAQFSVNGTTAHISLVMAESQIEQLLMPQGNKARAKKLSPGAQ